MKQAVIKREQETRVTSPPPDNHWSRLGMLATALAVGLLAVYILHTQANYDFALAGLRDHYLIFHIIMEALSVIVSFSVFIIAWYTYQQSHNKRDLFISLTFLLVGMIDFAHTVSFKGMPDFFSPNTVSKASTLWVLARLFAALGLLTAARINPNSLNRWLTPKFLLPMTLGIGVVVVGIEILRPEWIPPMYIEGIPNGHQTALKIWMEYVIIALDMTAVFAYERQRKSGHYDLVLLQAALVVSAFSELAFAQYFSAFDTMNMLGHVYKVLAYYLILRALFVSSIRRPYEELVGAHEELRRLAYRNEELYHEAEKSRSELERSFSLIGRALGTRVETSEILSLILRLASDSLNVPSALIALRDGADRLEVSATLGIDQAVSHIPMTGSLAGEVVRSMKPTWIEKLDGNSIVFRPMVDPRSRSVLSVPIMYQDACVGVLEVFSPEPNAFSQREADLLFTFSSQAGIALENARLHQRDRDIAERLQKGLLLEELPCPPGYDLAKFYKAAWGEEARVGGDFYDVIELPDGEIGLVMADVSGKGLNAAVYTAMAKYSLRAFAWLETSPSLVLARLNSAMIHYFQQGTNCSANNEEMPKTVFITIFFARLNQKTGRICYASAGHEPGLIADFASGEIKELESTGPVVGVMEGLEYTESEVELTPGSSLILYTDGVTEARNEGGFLETEGLKSILRTLADQKAEGFCQGIYRGTFEFCKGNQRDDIALLVAKREEIRD